MNTLSWLIYLADFADSIQAKFGYLALILLLAFLARAFVSTIDEYPFEKPAVWRPWMPILAAALLLVNAIIPSSGTIYAIAASELGEDVLNSHTGSKAVKALDAWLDRQIEGEKDGK